MARGRESSGTGLVSTMSHISYFLHILYFIPFLLLGVISSSSVKVKRCDFKMDVGIWSETREKKETTERARENDQGGGIETRSGTE